MEKREVPTSDMKARGDLRADEAPEFVALIEAQDRIVAAKVALEARGDDLSGRRLQSALEAVDDVVQRILA